MSDPKDDANLVGRTHLNIGGPNVGSKGRRKRILGRADLDIGGPMSGAQLDAKQS